jgi:TPR repeat protein
MGQAHELGIGVEKDVTEAIRWYRRAAEGGSSIAKERLSKLEPGK